MKFFRTVLVWIAANLALANACGFSRQCCKDLKHKVEVLHDEIHGIEEYVHTLMSASNTTSKKLGCPGLELDDSCFILFEETKVDWSTAKAICALRGEGHHLAYVKNNQTRSSLIEWIRGRVNDLAQNGESYINAHIGATFNVTVGSPDFHTTFLDGEEMIWNQSAWVDGFPLRSSKGLGADKLSVVYMRVGNETGSVSEGFRNSEDGRVFYAVCEVPV